MATQEQNTTEVVNDPFAVNQSTEVDTTIPAIEEQITGVAQEEVIPVVEQALTELDNGIAQDINAVGEAISLNPEDYQQWAKPVKELETPVLTEEQAGQVAAEALDLTDLSEEQLAGFDDFTLNAVMEHAETQAVMGSGDEELIKEHIQKRRDDADTYIKNLIVDPKKDFLAQVFEDIYKDGTRAYNSEIYIRQIAQHVREQSANLGTMDGIIEWARFGKTLNQAQYSTGGLGRVGEFLMDMNNAPTLTGGFVNAVANQMMSDEERANKLASLEFVKEVYAQVADIDPLYALTAEVVMDPANAVPFPFAKVGSAIVRFGKNFGIGAGITTFLEWLKDDDATLYEYMITAGFGGTLNGIFGEIAAKGGRRLGNLADDTPGVPEGMTNAAPNVEAEINREVDNIINDIADDAGITTPEVETPVTPTVDEQGHTIIGQADDGAPIVEMDMNPMANDVAADITGTSGRSIDDAVDNISGGQQKIAVGRIKEFVHESVFNKYEGVLKNLSTDALDSLSQSLTSNMAVIQSRHIVRAAAIDMARNIYGNTNIDEIMQDKLARFVIDNHNYVNEDELATLVKKFSKRDDAIIEDIRSFMARSTSSIRRVNTVHSVPISTLLMNGLMDNTLVNPSQAVNLTGAGSAVKLGKLFPSLKNTQWGERNARVNAATGNLELVGESNIYEIKPDDVISLLGSIRENGDMFLLNEGIYTRRSKTVARETEAVTPPPATTQDIKEIMRTGTISNIVEKLYDEDAYKNNPWARKIINSMGKVFKDLDAQYFHKYPILDAGELKAAARENGFQGVADKILTAYGTDVTYRVTHPSSNYTSIELFKNGVSTGRAEFEVRDGIIDRVNTVELTRSHVAEEMRNDGSLFYHILHEFAVAKDYKLKTGGLFQSNQPARPTHFLSTIMTRPQASSKLLMFDSYGMKSMLSKYRTASRKSPEGVIGNALLDVMNMNQKRAFPESGRNSGDIPHLEAPDELMNKFGFDSESGKFTFKGSVRENSEIAGDWAREADTFLTTRGHYGNYNAKGFNTQVKINVLGRALLSDLVNAANDAERNAVVSKYKSIMQRELSEESTTSTFRNIAYSFAPYAPGALGGSLAVAALAPTDSQAGELGAETEEGTGLSDVLTAAVAVGILALAGKKGYNAYMNRGTRAARVAEAKIYKEATEETLANVDELINKLQAKLEEPLSAQARTNVTNNMNRAKRVKELILRHNTFESLTSTIQSQHVADYLQAKQRPVVQVTEAQAGKLAQAFENGDMAGAVENIDFNLDRIDTSEEVIELIEGVSTILRDKVDLTRRGTVPLEDIMNSATEFGFDVEDLNNLYGDTGELAEKFTAARLLFIKIGDQAAALGTKIREAGINATDADRIEFARLLSLHASVHAMVKSSQTEIARALTSMRMTSKLNTSSSTQELEKVLQSLGKQHEGGLDEAMDLWMNATAGERAKIAKTIASPNAWKKLTSNLTEFWINSILGGFTTHLVNVMSNTIVAFDALAKQIATAESVDESFYALYGWWRGITEAPVAFGRALAKGESNLDKVGKYEIDDSITASYWGINNKIGATAMNWFGNVVRMPSRALAAEDDFFKMISYRMKLSTEAMKMAQGEGLSGRALKERVNQLMDDTDMWLKVKTNPEEAGADIVDHLTSFNNRYKAQLESMYETSIETARVNTFTNELGERGQSFQNFLQKNPEARFIVPFLRTPVNIMKFFGNRLPLVNAIGNEAYRKVITKKLKGHALTAEEIRTLKEFTYVTMTGAGMLYGAYEAAKSGKVTGMAPGDRSYTQEEEGWRPYSIVIDNPDGTKKYVPYNRFDPLAMFIGVAADLNVILHTEDKITTKTDEMLAAVMLSFVNNFVNKSYLQGINQFSEVISSTSTAKPEMFIRNFAASFIPNYVYGINKELDPIAREVHSISDAIAARIPGMSKDLKPRRDYRGRPKAQVSGIIPSNIGNTSNDPVSEAVRESGLNFTKPSKTIEGTNIEMNAEQYDYYTKTLGELFDQQARTAVGSSAWKKLQTNKNGIEGGRTTELRKFRTNATKGAKQKLLLEFPELKKKLFDNKRKQAENY